MFRLTRPCGAHFQDAHGKALMGAEAILGTGIAHIAVSHSGKVGWTVSIDTLVQGCGLLRDANH